jgi:hypothetical protein
MAKNIFARKPLEMLLSEAKDDNRLRVVVTAGAAGIG